MKNAVKLRPAPQGVVAAAGIECACEHRQYLQESNKPSTLAGSCERQFKALTTEQPDLFIFVNIYYMAVA
jgi:hypothetical protein